MPPEIPELICDKAYFVVVGPRQVGKTTMLLSYAAELTASGEYVAALLSCEVGQPFGKSPDAAERALLGSWVDTAAWQLPAELRPPAWPQGEPGSRVKAALTA